MTTTTLTTGPSADRGAAGAQRLNLSYHLVRIRRFLGTYGWLAHDGLLRNKRRVVAISLASVVGAAAQGGAIGLLILFVSVIESGGSTGVAAIDGLLGSNLSSLILVALLLVAMHLISATAQYIAARQARRIARAYHDRAASRALGLYCGSTLLDAEALDCTRAQARKIMAKQPRIMGKSLESIVSTINPVCSLVVAVVAMVLINLSATLVIVPVFILLLPVLYGVSHRIQRHANEYYGASATGMAQGVRDCFQMADATNVHGPRLRQQVLDRWASDEGISTGLDSYDDVLLGSARSTFATSLFRPAAITVVLLVLGYQALEGALPWSLLLGFLAALRQATGFLEQLAGNLALLNKFYRRVAEHEVLYKALREGGEADAPAVAVPDRVTLRSQQSIAGGLERAVITAGAPLLYYHPEGLGRFALSALIAPLARRGSADRSFWASACFMSGGHVFDSGAIAANVLGVDEPAPAQLEDLGAALTRLGVAAEVDGLPRGLATDVSELGCTATSPELRTAIKLLAVRASAAPVAFLELSVLQPRSPEWIDAALELLSDRYLVITTNRPNASVPAVEHVVVAADGDIAGIGDQDWWCAVRGGLTRGATAVEPDEDEDDEEEI